MSETGRTRNKRNPPEEDAPPSPNVGSRLRAVREERNLSLRALAERAGLSVNTISLIERGVNSPTVASLHLLARALDCPITEFFRVTADETVVLVRRDQRARFRRGGMELENLGAGLRDQQLEPFLVTVWPGQSDDTPLITHDGQEFVYCVQGQIEYEIGGRVFRLAAGDALLFEAAQPHRLRNSAAANAVVLLVFSGRDGHPTGRHQHLGG